MFDFSSGFWNFIKTLLEIAKKIQLCSIISSWKCGIQFSEKIFLRQTGME